jgi:hypothetical protein
MARREEIRSGRARQNHRSALRDTAGPAAMLALGFAGGVAAGVTIWSRLVDTNRRGLFSPHPVKRFAAVSYLGARPSVDTARLLRDYILWEPQPLLRRRARRVLRAVEASLER